MIEYFADKPRTELLVGNSAERIFEIPEGSVQCVFADPPFNYGVDYGEFQDDMEIGTYFQFMQKVLIGAFRALSENGSLWLNVPDEVVSHLDMFCRERLSLDRMNWCIWHYRFGQCTDARFIRSKVHILYFAKNRHKRIWNPQSVMELSDRATKYNDPRTKTTRTPGRRVPLDVWEFSRVQGNNKERRPLHPNQLPEMYLYRVIQATTNPGDCVLDPFCGSGTTSTVARALGRRSITIELSKEFAASAWERIMNGPIRKTEKQNDGERTETCAVYRG